MLNPSMSNFNCHKRRKLKITIKCQLFYFISHFVLLPKITMSKSDDENVRNYLPVLTSFSICQLNLPYFPDLNVDLNLRAFFVSGKFI